MCIQFPPPPLSTLFPYTTLFRSIAERKQFVDEQLANARSLLEQGRGEELLGALEAALEFFAAALLQEGDRKSTRLNSSHANISYAVFCLKKKKNTDST